MTSIASSMQFVRLLARLNPAIWDAIHPQGPVRAGSGVRLDARLVEAGLNPQPLPPKELFARSVVHGATAIAEAAIAADAAGGDAHQLLEDVGEEMCPSPPTLRFHWPRRWPPPPPPPDQPYPIEPGLLRQAVQAQAAVVFQYYAEGIADAHLSAPFGRLAERLTEAALEPAAGVRNGQAASV